MLPVSGFVMWRPEVDKEVHSWSCTDGFKDETKIY